MPVKPTGEETAAALKAWIASDIEGASQRIFDIAKFLFGVSMASIGLAITVYQFTGHTWGYYEGIGLLLFSISALFALYLAIPKRIKLTENTDLAAEHTSLVRATSSLVIAWAVAWLLSLLVFFLPAIVEITPT